MEQKREIIEVEETEIVEPEEFDSMVIHLKTPYKFEGQEYDTIDLTPLEDITGDDMIRVNKIMSRGTIGIDVMPEVSVEYALYLAAAATKKPVEFYRGLPPKAVMQIKNRVMGFLFGTE